LYVSALICVYLRHFQAPGFALAQRGLILERAWQVRDPAIFLTTLHKSV
jgi:hypothetical protein